MLFYNIHVTEQVTEYIRTELGERAYDELLMAQESFELGKKHKYDDRDKVQVEFSTAAFSLRKVLERLVAHIADEHGVRYDSENDDLFTVLTTLQKKKAVSNNVFDYANQVRKIGNRGAHGVDMTEEECNSGFAALENLVITYIEEDTKGKKKKRSTAVKAVFAIIILVAIVVACLVLMTYIE